MNKPEHNSEYNSKPTPYNEANSTDEITPDIQYIPLKTIGGDNSIGHGICEFPPIRQLNENQVKYCRPHDSVQDDMHSTAYNDQIGSDTRLNTSSNSYYDLRSSVEHGTPDNQQDNTYFEDNQREKNRKQHKENEKYIDLEITDDDHIFMYSGFKTFPFPTDMDNETPRMNITNKEENTEPENIKTQPDLNSQTNSHYQDIRKLVTPVSFDICRRQKSST